MYHYDAYEDPIQRPRYTGLPTFMRAPFREDYAARDKIWIISGRNFSKIPNLENLFLKMKDILCS